MVLLKKIIVIVLISLIGFNSEAKVDAGVRIKDLCRLAVDSDNALVGYGIVTGLAGTGDSPRSYATLQSVKNLLQNFNVNVPLENVRSRNTAAVMVTATLPAYAQQGNKLDINVTSIGDARSLLGGTLLLTHLKAVNDRIYATAQGPVSVGGYSYDLNGNVVQKNHPTAAYIPNGANVERGIETPLMDKDGNVQYVLHEPDFATADRIRKRLTSLIGPGAVKALDAARINIKIPENLRHDVVGFISRVEQVKVVPDRPSRIVVNERTGTVVAGGGVTIAPVTISHGDLNVAISTEFIVSQPFAVFETGSDVRTQVVPQSEISVDEEVGVSLSLPNHSTVSELVSALNKIKTSSRDIITILQGIKRAGALNAELVVQ